MKAFVLGGGGAKGALQVGALRALLEAGLQPCGWLAAYLGSALTSDVDLKFRNLDGNAVQHRPVTPASGTLTTRVKITRIASSGGMIIQGYEFAISDRVGPVYSGDTVFGFFSSESLARQVDTSSVDGRAHLVELARPLLQKLPSTNGPTWKELAEKWGK